MLRQLFRCAQGFQVRDYQRAGTLIGEDLREQTVWVLVADHMHAAHAAADRIFDGRRFREHAILQAALAAGADYLVTNDRHLLALHPYEGLRIISMTDYFELLRSEGLLP